MESWSPKSLLKRVKALDAYPKVNEDFFTRTLSGGIITIIAIFFMSILFISEIVEYSSVKVVNELSIDRTRGEQMQINVDMVLHNLGCAYISIDVMDVSGEIHLHVDDHEILKQRLDAFGKPIKLPPEKEDVGPEVIVSNTTLDANSTETNATLCMSCYGAELYKEQCCNTCEEVRDAYRTRNWALEPTLEIVQCKNDKYTLSIQEQKNEGCHIKGQLLVNKVAGNFHIAPGKSFQQGRSHFHDLIPFGENAVFNTSHTITTLSFGRHFPGLKNPLSQSVEKSEIPSLAYKYYLKVVPTIYRDLRGRSISTNQYSVTEQISETQTVFASDLPGLFFYYDISPIKVLFREHRIPFLHFLTNVCAIVGGIFTVSGMIDAIWYHGHKIIKQKMELGKFQ